MSLRFLGKRVKFIWGSSRVIRGDWHAGLFGFYDRVEGHRRDGLAISLRGTLLWGASTALLAHFAAAGIAYNIRSRSPFNQVTYADLVLAPLRRERISDLTGQAQIAEGLADLRRGARDSGAAKVALGLQRHPGDPDARLVLARHLAEAGEGRRAAQVLMEGLGLGYPGRAHLELLWTLAMTEEDFETAVAAFRQCAARPEARADRAWLREKEVRALIGAGRAAEAVDVARSEGADATPGSREVLCLALIDLGRADEALAPLAAWRASPGCPLATILKVQVRAFRALSRWKEMDVAIHEARDLGENDPAVWADGVAQWVLARQPERAAAEFADFDARFGTAARNMEVLSQALAGVAEERLLQRCVDLATERGLAFAPLEIDLAQAQLSLGKWSAALQTIQQARSRLRMDGARERGDEEWMERLADACASPAHAIQAHLLAFLEGRTLSLPVMRRIATVLKAAGRQDTAQQVAILGERRYPLSPFWRSMRTGAAANPR